MIAATWSTPNVTIKEIATAKISDARLKMKSVWLRASSAAFASWAPTWPFSNAKPLPARSMIKPISSGGNTKLSAKTTPIATAQNATSLTSQFQHTLPRFPMPLPAISPGLVGDAPQPLDVPEILCDANASVVFISC
ncbi:hypothetical protein HFO49_03440 [Rhizobium leguminosarum]|uniref:hypothetical protein n=1 Tax=Rhizobium leguminosarum TaxID=384 RepID=UPI001C944A4F|nr:hypothetical protein [Rhizobium leguminosarum]MBY5586542.1 hypothetical protein [Rhizobium leguminosarum]